MEAAQLQVGHPGSLGSLWCPVRQEWTETELSSKPSLLSCQAALPKKLCLLGSSACSHRDTSAELGSCVPLPSCAQSIPQLTPAVCPPHNSFSCRKRAETASGPAAPQKESGDGSLHLRGRARGQNRGAAQALAPSALCVAWAQLGISPACLLDVGTTTHPKLVMQEPVGQRQMRDVVSSW